jgi:Domain of unknown function (DUF4145)
MFTPRSHPARPYSRRVSDAVDERDDGPIAREGEYVAPAYRATAFHCPRCGVLSNQEWEILQERAPGGGIRAAGVWRATCRNCLKASLWLPVGSDGRMVEPVTTAGPRPHAEMPQDARADYDEARTIVALSPRGACGMLRLATQKLVDDLVKGNGRLDDKIGTLVSQGLRPEVAQALDVLRVVGNNALHPGEMALDDDVRTATALFECLNMIVEDRVARPKRVAELFGKLPQGARAAIERRDS